MNCEDFSDVFLDLARRQLLDAGARDGALRHAANCDHCRTRLEEERRLSVNLQALAQVMKPWEAGQQIETQVLAAFRSRRSVAGLPLKARRRKYWVTAAAAVVLALVAVLMTQRIHRLAPRENQVAGPNDKIETPLPTPKNERKSSSESATKDRPLKDSMASKPRDLPSYSVPSRRADRGIRRPSRSDLGNGNNEIATEFFPVGDTSALSLADGGQLVRVQLPRSTLMRFGLPVNVDRANERVKADVLLGSDGVARAIRFVR